MVVVMGRWFMVFRSVVLHGGGDYGNDNGRGGC